jgi:hypothetical protein
MDKKAFLARYTSFWVHINQGRQIPPNLKQAAENYYIRLKNKGVLYEKFDYICTCLEEEMSDFSPTFNIVSYVLDWIRAEKQEALNQFALKDKEPVYLPAKRTPLNIDKFSTKAQEYITRNEKIKVVMEKLNSIPKRVTDACKCAACIDSGFIIFSVNVNTEGKKKIKVNDISDRPTYTFVKRCQCPKGKSMADCIKLSLNGECIESARINEGAFMQDQEYVPF